MCPSSKRISHKKIENKANWRCYHSHKIKKAFLKAPNHPSKRIIEIKKKQKQEKKKKKGRR